MEDELEILAIDQDRLDEEWVNQPTFFFKYAAKLASAREKLAEAKAELKVVESDLARDIRDRPRVYGLDKVTENAVKELIPLQHAHEQAVSQVTKAAYKVDLLDAAVTALDHRKKALESLVYLHGQNYFSSPRPPDPETAERVRERVQGSSRKKGIKRRNR